MSSVTTAVLPPEVRLYPYAPDRQFLPREITETIMSYEEPSNVEGHGTTSQRAVAIIAEGFKYPTHPLDYETCVIVLEYVGQDLSDGPEGPPTTKGTALRGAVRVAAVARAFLYEPGPLVEANVLAHMKGTTTLPSFDTLLMYQQMRPRPILSPEAAVIVNTYSREKADTRPEYNSRLKAICQTFGIRYDGCMEFVAYRNLSQSDTKGKPETAWKNFDLNFDVPLLFQQIDETLSRSKKKASLEDLNTYLFNGLFPFSFPSRKAALSLFHDKTVMVLPHVEADPSRYGSLDGFRPIPPNYLGLLTLILRNYPDWKTTLTVMDPVDAPALIDHVAGQPALEPRQGAGSFWTVFLHNPSPEGPISLFKLSNRDLFLGESLVTAILNSGRTLCEQDLTQALVHAFVAPWSWRFSSGYCERLLAAGADAQALLVSGSTNYFYGSKTTVQGSPLLFETYRRALCKTDYLETDLAKELQFSKGRRKLDLLCSHGASYNPQDLYSFYPGLSTALRVNLVDYLIAEGSDLPTPFVINIIGNWMKEKGLLPNLFSLMKIIQNKHLPLEWVDFVASKTPHLFDELLNNRIILAQCMGNDARFKHFTDLCEKLGKKWRESAQAARTFLPKPPEPAAATTAAAAKEE
jgi:hypothetical protein